ncbi:hypothetical protein AA313_de0203274 [Arthrobotrys entomopaga]|nr:hypothetical protein AA313_de0203274 [Arthrobotrys entomopaga]
MGTIYVFDISSQIWYTVAATGAIPRPRQLFCTGLSTAPDSSTFQITMFGGLTEPTNDTTIDTTAERFRVYTLIIPTFHWLDVTPTVRSFGTDAEGRYAHRCEVWQDTQMFIVGGYVDPENGTNYSTDCQQKPPLLVLDINTFEWKDRFNPTQENFQPRVVYEVVGGDANGGNTKKAPAAGFNNPALSTIFANVLPKISQPTSFVTAAGPNPSATTTNSINPTNGGGSPKSKVAIIAGSVSGGIVLIGLIAGFIYYFCSRRRRIWYDHPPIIIGHDSSGNPVYSGRFGGIQGAPVASEILGGVTTEIVGGVDHVLPVGGISSAR